MADRHVDALIVGGGVAGAACAAALHEGGFDGHVLIVGPRAGPALRAPARLQGLPGGHDGPQRVPAARRRVVRAPEPRARHAHERDEARHRGAHRDPLHQGGRGVRRRAARHGRERPPPARRRRPARRHPLPARARQRRRDPRRRARRPSTSCSSAGPTSPARSRPRSPRSGAAARWSCSRTRRSSAHFGAAASGFFTDLLRRKGVELVTGDGLERFEGDGARASASSPPRAARSTPTWSSWGPARSRT